MSCSLIAGSTTVVAGDVISAYFISTGSTTLTFPAGVAPTDLSIEGDLSEVADDPLPEIDDPILETPTGTVNGSNTTFTAVTGGWLPDELTVLHDSLDQTAHVASQNAVTGVVTLDYAPSGGSTIRLRYRSR